MDESRERKNYHSEYNEHMNGIAFHNQDAWFSCANINIHHAQRTTSGAKAFEEKCMFFFCGNRQKESQANWRVSESEWESKADHPKDITIVMNEWLERKEG